MALFDKKKKLYAYEVIREGEEIILRINCEGTFRIPSLEDDPLIMAGASINWNCMSS